MRPTDYKPTLRPALMPAASTNVEVKTIERVTAPTVISNAAIQASAMQRRAIPQRIGPTVAIPPIQYGGNPMFSPARPSPRSRGGSMPQGITTGGPVTSPTPTGNGDSTPTNYNVPDDEPDKPYVPPPVAHDLPGQYDFSPYEKPAMVNTALAAAMSPTASVTAIVPVITTKATLFDRILSFFGLARSKVIGAKMAGEAANLASMSRTDAAYSLVRRSRNGDQNAMAMLAAVRDQALAGNKQAEVSLRLMHAYIKAHPIDENAAPDGMGAEQDHSTLGAAVELSHGPILTDSRLQQLTGNLSDYEKGAFRHGMSGGRLAAAQHPRTEAAHKLGIAAGAARVMQASRMPHVPLGRINPDVGWELDD